MKKLIFIFLGVFIVGLLISFNHYTREYFNNNDKIIKKINTLKQKELKLNSEILSISLYLYRNFDEIVNLEKEIDKTLKDLENDEEFKKHKFSYRYFLEYKKAILEKIESIYRLETIIAPLKNSDMYIAELITKLELKENKKYFLNITSQIFLAKNSFDLTFLNDLDKNLLYLKNINSKNKFYITFVKNVELFNKLFPEYVTQMDRILNFETKKELDNVLNKFLKESNEKLNIITFVSVLLILFVVVSILLILYLFFKLEKENQILEKISITDNLTKLYNRRKLEIDIKEAKNPVLLIVNIDRFKYYNDFYGTQIGDFILQEMAQLLKIEFPKNYNPSFYRLGGDDFGILFEYNRNIDLESISAKLIKNIQNKSIKHKDIELHISVSIGISFIQPLIETADIALKLTKKNTRYSYSIYNPKFNEREAIERNLINTHILKSAIENDRIIPYYQPIFSNKTSKIVKYEVLARIIDGDKIMSIYPFLNIAKENKIYKNITQMIYKKAFEKFKDKKIEFSLNISIEDIMNDETMNFINRYVDKYPEIFKYITFEILEDDAIKNYDLLKEFIGYMKCKGAKIAIDDFGSGYSNFGHVLNLDIDYLKIDGSLIKNLDNDKKMEIIVETIVNFANKTGMKVIGEYVHKKEVLDKVKELNIDYSQGFYLGEPKGDL